MIKMSIYVIYISMCNNMYKHIPIYCVTLRYSRLTKYIIIYAEGCSGFLHFGFSLAFKENKYVVFVNCCDFKVQTYFWPSFCPDLFCPLKQTGFLVTFGY